MMTVGGRSTMSRSPKMHAIINGENDGFALLSLSRARDACCGGGLVVAWITEMAVACVVAGVDRAFSNLLDPRLSLW